jgi:hypothetical protein
MVAHGEIAMQQMAFRDGTTEWCPLEQVVGFHGLPPLPPPEVPAPSGPIPRVAPPIPPRVLSQTLAPLSGSLGVVLLVLSIFAVGSCNSAQHDLDAYRSQVNSPQGAAETFLRSLQRGANGDPFGEALDLAEASRSLEARFSEAQGWAIVCLVATAVCGGGAIFLGRRTRHPQP